MKLSKNFYLSEFTESATAKRLGIENHPNITQLENLQELVSNVLQPLRDIIGAIRITSGFRNPKLSLAVGSNELSQHCKGQAADIQFHDRQIINNKKIFHTIIDYNIPFDQLIEEFNYSWIHISYKCENNRKQILSAYKDNGKTKYKDITKNYIK